MGEGMERVAGEAMKRILGRLTSSVWRGVALGTVTSAVLHSSSLTTVMLVGFVNAGLMTLQQSLGVIYGANIGTTVTAQMLRLNIGAYALPLICIGMVLRFTARSERFRNIGYALLGLGILFHGLILLGSGSDYLLANPAVGNALQRYASNPILAMLMGALFTGLIQSSGAATGLVIALVRMGLLNLPMAAGIILGCNIGTCVTALLASSMASRAAKRTAIAHLGFNLTGSLVILPFFYPFVAFIEGTSGDITGQVANMHTIFNVMTSIGFVPFTKIYADLLYKLVPGEREEVTVGAQYLDRLLLNTPDIALEASFRELTRSNTVAFRMLKQIHQGLQHNDKEHLSEIHNDEQLLNEVQREVNRYMVEITAKELSTAQSQLIPDIINVMNDIERVGDLSYNLIEQIEEKIRTNISFSPEAAEQLDAIMDRLDNLNQLVQECLTDRDLNLSDACRSLHQEVKELCEGARQGHVSRLEQGTCTVDAGIFYMDIISNYEHISEHMQNIAFACEKKRRSHNR